MIRIVLIILMMLLTVFVLHSAARIEVLNIQAGTYLPRRDRGPDGTLADGKWRVSPENTPRDQLRDVVQTLGLMQYVLAPLLLVFSLVIFFRFRRSWARVAAPFSMFAAVVAISLMFYRDYFGSLGW